MQKDFFVLQVGESIEKSRYAEYVLRKLAAWFADEEALREYIQGVKDSLLWAAFDRNDSCIGFFSIKTHYQCIGEIYVCGVLPELRGRGIGRAILSKAGISAVNYFERNVEHRKPVFDHAKEAIAKMKER